jgi:hypothetical protein
VKNIGVEADGGSGILASSGLRVLAFASAAWWRLGFEEAERLHHPFYRLGRLGEPRDACGADVEAGGCGRLRIGRGWG